MPLTVMKKSLDVLKLARIVAEKGNENSISDAGVAGLMGLAAVEGAWYNVRIHLTSLTDGDFVTATRQEAETVAEEAQTTAAIIRKRVESSL